MTEPLHVEGGLEGAMRHVGLRMYFILHLQQRPGVRHDVLYRLGPEDDVAGLEEQKKSAGKFGSIRSAWERDIGNTAPVSTQQGFASMT
jgi:hypothetical protein